MHAAFGKDQLFVQSVAPLRTGRLASQAPCHEQAACSRLGRTSAR
jgi:hypothetical protein